MEYEEIKPSVGSLKNVGDQVEGILISKEPSKKYGNMEYWIENKEGHRKIFGTTVLDERMKFVNVGDYVKIEFTAIEKNKKGQDTKIFKVYKAKKA